MKTRRSTLLTALAACVALTPHATRASILTSGNYKTGTPTPTFAIDAPFTLTVTAQGYFNRLDLDGWVTSDDSQNNVAPLTPQTLSYQISGGPVRTLGVSNLVDNFAFTYGAFTPNDGYLLFNTSVAVTAGQTVTFFPGTLTFGSDPSFNPPPATFNGNVFMVDDETLTPLSAPTSVNQVPEPSTWAFVAAGAAGLGVVLRQRRRAA